MLSFRVEPAEAARAREMADAFGIPQSEMSGVGDLLPTLNQKPFAVVGTVYVSNFSHKSVQVAHVGSVTVAVFFPEVEDVVKRDGGEVEADRLEIKGDQLVS